jgi:hypothetical protein
VNGASLPEWPAYTAPEYRWLEYGNEIIIGSNADDRNLDFFRRVFELMRRKTGEPTKASKNANPNR